MSKDCKYLEQSA